MRVVLDHIVKRFGSVDVIPGLDLLIEDGEMLALLGPSGCGKTTTLFAISGIYRVDGGRIMFGDRDVTMLPPQRRNVGVVFQSYALYPHMTARDNIAFPLTIRGDARAKTALMIREMAGLLRLEHLLDRRPAELSGGQQQRVALARALVRRPDVLLLDEPLANLDAKLRMDMRAEIRRVQQETGITAILVTHDQVEAMSMCDRIAIMNDGRIVQIATPTDMYERPADAFVAGFLGSPPIAFLDGELGAGDFHVAESSVSIPLKLNGHGPAPGPLRIGIRPEHYGPDPEAPTIPGRVTFVETHGREKLYTVEIDGGARLRSIQPAHATAVVGSAIAWSVRPERILLFDKDGTRLRC